MYSQLIVMVRKACIGVPQPLSAQQEIWFMSRVTLFMTVTMCRVVSCLTRRPEMYKEMVGIGVPIAIHSTVMLAPSATMFTGCTVGACTNRNDSPNQNTTKEILIPLDFLQSWGLGSQLCEVIVRVRSIIAVTTDLAFLIIRSSVVLGPTSGDGEFIKPIYSVFPLTTSSRFAR